MSLFLAIGKQVVDGRNKSGHDEVEGNASLAVNPGFRYR